MNGDEEDPVVGVQKLLADYDETISLIPAENERHARRMDVSLVEARHELD